MKPKNIVFDIGNVLVKWAPKEVVIRLFPDYSDHDDLTLKFFKSPAWFDLNKGKLTEAEVVQIYHQQLGISVSKLNELMFEVKESLTPMEGSFDLLEKLYQAKIPLYSITDNVHEIVAFLKKRYTFFDKFIGVVVSADLGVLKPAKEIYHHLLKTYDLNPKESIFFDDVQINVNGAQNVGMLGVQFTTAEACRIELKNQGFIF